MYDELIKRLREAAKMSEALAVLLPHSEGNAVAKLHRDAADAIEELRHENKSLAKSVNEAADLLHKRGTPPKWISVTERLPETGVDVLVMFPQNMAVASRDMGEWVVNSGDGWCTDVNLSDDEKEPTHWMPLPQPPKEET